MSLVSLRRALDPDGSRPRPSGARLRSRVGMLLAATMSLVLAGTTVAQSPSPEGSAAPSPAAPALEGTLWILTATGLEPNAIVSTGDPALGERGRSAVDDADVDPTGLRQQLLAFGVAGGQPDVADQFLRLLVRAPNGPPLAGSIPVAVPRVCRFCLQQVHPRRG